MSTRKKKNQQPSDRRAPLVPGARVIIWARVSSREQAEEGWSTGEQVRECSDLCKREHWDVARVFEVVESATRARREYFREALELARSDRTIAAIVSIRLDRLLRGDAEDVLTLEYLRKKDGLKLRFVKERFDENAYGEFMFKIALASTGLETDRSKERIQEGFLGRAKEGWYPHPPIFPWVVGDKTLGEPPIRLDPERPARAALARRMFEVIAERRCTVDDAREIVFSEGHIYSTKSKRIPRSIAFRLVRDRFAYGEFEFQGVVYTGKHEPLILRELWQRVQDVLDGRGGRPYGKGKIPYLGVVKCGLCGHAVTCEPVKKKLKSGEVRVHGYLRCSMRGTGAGKQNCQLPRLKVAQIEAMFGELVETLAVDDETLEALRVKLHGSHDDHVQRVAKTLESLRRQLTQAEERKKRAFALAIDGGMEAPLLAEKIAEIDKDVVRLRADVARLEGESRTYYKEGVRVIELAQRLRTAWVDGDSAERRRILDFLVLNCVWDGVTLRPEWRRPFGLLAERPSLTLNRGDRI